MTGNARQITTTWDELGWQPTKSGGRSSRLLVGDADDAPMVMMVRFPPGAVVQPHTHDTDYCEMILEGEQTIGKHTHGAGTVRVVKAGTGYGPITCGPEGAVALFFFRDHRAQPAVPLPRQSAAASG